MFYLFLALLSSAMVSILMRISENHIRNRISMLACNYAMCSFLALASAGFVLSPSAGTVCFGAGSGVVYLLGFLLLQWNIRKNGVVLSGLFMKLGVTVPVIVSLLFFGEKPGLPHIAGILLSLTGILLMNSAREGAAAKNIPALILLLAVGGACDVAAKIFEETGPKGEGALYLLCTFFTALILCSALALVKRQKLTLADAGFGLLVGIPNFFSSRFLLLSLAQIPAVAAYPIYCIGAMTLITIAGVAFFHEKLSRRQIAAACVIVLALVLLNL